MTPLEKNFRFYIGCKIGNVSSLFWLNYYRSQFKNNIITKETDICIEGFHRSGNSFFFRVFRKYNQWVTVAHHMHASMQVQNALKYNIPVIVLIRRPEDAIASLLTWDNSLSVQVAIKCYIDFYKPLLSKKEKFVVARFSVVTSKPSRIINRVNRKFNTKFFVPTLDEKTLEKMKNNLHSNQTNHLISPVPNEAKEVLNQKNKQIVLEHPLLEKANDLYHSFVK